MRHKNKTKECKCCKDNTSDGEKRGSVDEGVIQRANRLDLNTTRK